MLKIAVFLLLLYLLLLLTVFCFQRRLLYFPSGGRLSRVQLEAYGWQAWPDGEDWRGYLYTPQQTVRGTVIVFHGNAGSASDRTYYVRALGHLGYRVLLAEYPGYGGRPGVATEKVLAEDARDTIQLVNSRLEGPVFLWGESLGAAVVSAAVVDSSLRVQGLVLLTPWASLVELAAELYWYLPVRWLLLDKFDSVLNLRGFSAPVAVIVAGRDDIVPPRHAMRLYESIEAVRLWRFEDAGHNDWPTAPGLRWWREVMDFVSASASRRQRSENEER